MNPLFRQFNFQDAQDFDHLKRMLNEFMFKLEMYLVAQNIDMPPIPTFTGRAASFYGKASGLNVGALISSNADGTLTRADTQAQIEACGVVTRELVNNAYEWRPVSIVEIPLADGNGFGFNPLYLGRNGFMQTTQPMEGAIQRVGFTVNYDPRTALYTVFVNPGPMSIG